MFLDKRQPLKARIHETRGIFVDFNVRVYSHQQMDKNSGRFKMQALQILAGDELKADVNNSTSSFRRSSMTFSMCVGSYDRNQKGLYKVHLTILCQIY